MLIEDVHWAEEPLLDLIERLGGDVRGPAAAARDRSPGLSSAGRTRWSGRVDTRDDLARAACRRDAGERSSTRLLAHRAAASRPRADRRARGGQPVLRRGGPRRASSTPAPRTRRRRWRAETTCRRASRSRTPCRPCSQHASTCSPKREGGVAGRRRDRARLLDRPGLRVWSADLAPDLHLLETGTSSADAPDRRSRGSASTRSSTRSRARWHTAA